MRAFLVAATCAAITLATVVLLSSAPGPNTTAPTRVCSETVTTECLPAAGSMGR